jgi:hypothetical protein
MDFFICNTLPIGGVQIAGSIVLGQYKGHKRIGEARTTIRRALPIVMELAYQCCCTDCKWRYVHNETMANSKFKIMPSGEIQAQYLTIGALLDPP